MMFGVFSMLAHPMPIHQELLADQERPKFRQCRGGASVDLECRECHLPRLCVRLCLSSGSFAHQGRRLRTAPCIRHRHRVFPIVVLRSFLRARARRFLGIDRQYKRAHCVIRKIPRRDRDIRRPRPMPAKSRPLLQKDLLRQGQSGEDES